MGRWFESNWAHNLTYTYINCNILPNNISAVLQIKTKPKEKNTVMEAQMFVTQAKRLHSSQVAFITFNKDGIIGVSRLIGLTRSCPGVSIATGDLSAIMAVEMSRDWGHDRNRTVQVCGLTNSDPALLAPIARDVEKIAVPEHAAKALFTTRTRMFEEAAAKITRDVITDELRKEVEDWGLNIFSDPRMSLKDNLPGIDFTIRNMDNETIFSVILDGWSGRLFVNGEWGNCCYTQPRQLQFIIRKNLEACLEKLTAAT